MEQEKGHYLGISSSFIAWTAHTLSRQVNSPHTAVDLPQQAFAAYICRFKVEVPQRSNGQGKGYQSSRKASMSSENNQGPEGRDLLKQSQE